jgi:hypothetical protein
LRVVSLLSLSQKHLRPKLAPLICTIPKKNLFLSF